MRIVLSIVLLVSLCACDKAEQPKSGTSNTGGQTSFTLAWSEYPSWSTFGVADELGLINGKEGEQGSIEKKHGVDIVLKQADYDTCITMYASNTADAACLTNMDTLAPSIGRKSVAILPTSTSVGADACIAVGANTIQDLNGKTTYGLEKSVSQYAFERTLTKQGLNPKEFTFKNMDPAAAAQAMQTSQANVESIMVWNPFVLQTLRTRKDSKVLLDSSTIPEEIIDMVVVGADSLAKPGGDKFAAAVVETYYEINRLLESKDQGDKVLIALGSKFSNLGLDDMKIVVKQTQFYKTPAEAKALFTSEKFRNETTPAVVKFCVENGIVDTKPSVGFDDPNAQLNLTTRYLR
jgi:ABC-type nitrate/sulfonate/bicarbonate transport system substrate-binding protein